MKKILIVDGNNLGWMSFGMAPLSYQGERTEVISIGLNMIRNYLFEFEPDEAVIIWDGGRDKERLELYPDYKRHRRELTEVEKRERDLFFKQVGQLQETLTSLGITQYQLFKPKREADDVIYSLIENMELGGAPLEHTHHYTVVSSDQDFFQLLMGLSSNVVIYSPIKKLLIDRRKAEEILGVDIDSYLDYRGMVGDLSDNLPGVKGIGPVGAKWLVENVLTGEGDGLVPKAGYYKYIKLLDTNYDQFKLMKGLMRFRLISQDELNRGRISSNRKPFSELQEAMIRICTQYGFEQAKDNFVSFVAPWEQLWRKNENI